MTWRWPWRRPADPGLALQRTAAPDAQWLRLPPIQRTVEDIEPTAALDGFTASLATAQNPGVLSPAESLAADHGGPLPLLGVEERPAFSAPAPAPPRPRTWRPALNLPQRMRPEPATAQRAQDIPAIAQRTPDIPTLTERTLDIPAPPAPSEVTTASVPGDLSPLTRALEPAEHRQVAAVTEPVTIPPVSAPVVEAGDIPAAAAQPVTLDDRGAVAEAALVEPTTGHAVAAPSHVAAPPAPMVAASPRPVQRTLDGPITPPPAPGPQHRRDPQPVVAQRFSITARPSGVETRQVPTTPPAAEPPAPLRPQATADAQVPTVLPAASEDASGPVPGAPVQPASADPGPTIQVLTTDPVPTVQAPTGGPVPTIQATAGDPTPASIRPITPSGDPTPAPVQRAPEAVPRPPLQSAPLPDSTAAATLHREATPATLPVEEEFSSAQPVLRLRPLPADPGPAETPVAAGPSTVVRRATTLTPPLPQPVTHLASRTSQPATTVDQPPPAPTAAPPAAIRHADNPVAQRISDRAIPAGAKVVILPPVRRSTGDTPHGVPERRSVSTIFESQRPTSLQRMFEHTATLTAHRATLAPTPATPGTDGETPDHTEITFDQYAVQRAAENPPDSEPAGSAPAPEAPNATVAATQPPTPAGPSATDIDELVHLIYDPLAARLRAELWLDRERAGVLMDLHR